MTVKGFTAAQRRWILRRDLFQCQFLTYDTNRHTWALCSEKSGLQVHHILPRGWVKLHLPHMMGDDSVNAKENGITLCGYHHVGENSEPLDLYVIHPDNWIAKQAYRLGNKNAYQDMMALRVLLNETGTPYWNTRWDWMLIRRAKLLIARYEEKKPKDAYPKRR